LGAIIALNRVFPVSDHFYNQALKQELAYASYLNVPAVVLPPPRNRQHVADYARSINACLKSTTAYLHISVRMPIYDPRSASPDTLSKEDPPENVPLSVHARAPDGDLSTTWEMWDVIRSICGYSPRLSLGKRSRLSEYSLILYSSRPFSSSSLIFWCIISMGIGALLSNLSPCNLIHIQRKRMAGAYEIDAGFSAEYFQV